MQVTDVLLILLSVSVTFVKCQNVVESSERGDNAPESADDAERRRATWLDTRSTEDNFKELVYLSIQELIAEGRLSPRVNYGVSEPPQDKRNKHQGFCFRKTRTGRYLPYICWKEIEQEE
jgi:hypothetical protein